MLNIQTHTKPCWKEKSSLLIRAKFVTRCNESILDVATKIVITDWQYGIAYKVCPVSNAIVLSRTFTGCRALAPAALGRGGEASAIQRYQAYFSKNSGCIRILVLVYPMHGGFTRTSVCHQILCKTRQKPCRHLCND